MNTVIILTAALAFLVFFDLVMLSALMLVVVVILIEHLRVTRIGRRSVEMEARHVEDEPRRNQAGKVLRP